MGDTAKMRKVRIDFFHSGLNNFLKNAKEFVIFKTFDLTFMECDICLYVLLPILLASGKGSHILLLRNWQCLFEKLKKFR